MALSMSLNSVSGAGVIFFRKVSIVMKGIVIIVILSVMILKKNSK